MGIDVSARRIVSFNGAHEQRVVTDPGRPIPFARAGDIETASIFRRRRFAHDDFDGNPLIYALKGKHGYTITRGDFRAIYQRASVILPLALRELGVCDAVVPLPSSSGVASILAKRASRHLNSGILDCLEKATVGHALQNLPAAKSVPKRLRSDFTSLLNTWQRLPPNSRVEMKLVKHQLRPFVRPIIAGANAAACHGQNVLLVDDIYGSGTSLTSAFEALQPFGPARVTGLTLLSRLS